MATTKYSDLLNDVLPHLAADPSDPVTEYHIRRAVIEFCADSWIWKYIPDPADIVAGESYYDIEIPTGTVLSSVLSVTYTGVPLDNKSTDWLDAEVPGWQTTQASVKYFTQIDLEQVILAPVPEYNVTEGLLMTLALQPSQSSVGFPSWIYNQYAYSLADGAVGYLMLMPNKPWTDFKMGATKMASFLTAKASARQAAVNALARAPVRTKGQH